MLQQQNRLKHDRDFEILFKEGKFVNGEFTTLKYWKIQPEKYPRRIYAPDELKIGFVVGLKVSKSAVKRNRLKRQMREVVRLLLKDDRMVKGGYHLALVAKPNMIGKEYKDIERDIVFLLRRAGMLRPSVLEK